MLREGHPAWEPGGSSGYKAACPTSWRGLVFSSSFQHCEKVTSKIRL